MEEIRVTVAQPVKRVGMLFSGGPAPAANAVISAAALAFLNAGIEVVGFLYGFENLERYSPERPLVEGRDWLCLTRDDVSGIRNDTTILLRTSRANPGKAIETLDDLADETKNAKLRAVFDALDSVEVDALISIGGDDTLKTANYLFRMQERVSGLRPVRVVHLPKTIDNDYYGIDWTFGFTSAANFAAHEIRNLSSDAKSTRVWWVLEIMGRKAGWLTYAAGIAGEATRMISVEDCDETFDAVAFADEMAAVMEAREAEGRSYGVVCIAEGLADRLPDEQRPSTTDDHGNIALGAAQVGKLVAAEMAKAYARHTGRAMKVQAKQIGYETRCTPPIAFDVMLGSQLGVGACRAIVEEGLTGHMVSVRDQLQLVYVPFDELIDPATLKTRIRFIKSDSDFYRLARSLEYQQSSPPETGCT
jgi:6-phosphofructokinase